MKAKKAPEIDWNRWHQVIVDAIVAFEFDATLYICDRCNIRHCTKAEDDGEHEKVSTDTLMHMLFSVSETMLKEHLAGGLQKPDHRTHPDVNMYRDDAGIITAEIELCQEGESIMLNPCISMKLYAEPGKENLVITFQPSGQFY